MSNRFYLSSCSLMATLLASPALAQEAPPATQPETGGSTQIDEIVVTAQRFSESAQNAPVIISVVTADELRGVSDIKQLQTVQPSIQLGLNQTFIRGVGSQNAQNIQESAVSYNLDGVFLSTGSMISPQMYDLERIEVLKGPQGTLYGRNASGGAINLITAGPTLNQFLGNVEAEAGNFDLRRFVGVVNVPVSSTLAVRLAAQHLEHDGYLSDGTDDENTTSARVRLRWEPSEAVSLQLGVDGSRSDLIGAGSSVTPNPTGDDFVGALDPRLDTGPYFLGGTSLLSSPPSPSPFYKNDQWGVNAQLDTDLGFATLTAVPAYRSEKLRYRNYVGGFENNTTPEARQSSLEVRLSNRTDALKWVFGLYYFEQTLEESLRIRNEANFQDASVPDQEKQLESYAAFGEATFSLTERFRAIAGLRYTHEESTLSGSANARVGAPGVFNPITGAPNIQTDAFNPFDPFANPTGELLDYPFGIAAEDEAVTWKLGAEFDVGSNSLLFATVSRGFKGGGAYVDVPGTDPTFRPEYLTAFEIGSRNRFLDNTLQVNAELFYWKLEDQQIPYVGLNSVSQVTFITANAGEGHMYGAGLDVVWRASADDTLRAGVEYLRSEYDSFVRTAPSLAVVPATRCSLSNYQGPLSAAPTVIDCGGQPMLRAPQWSGSASYEHRFDLGAGGGLIFNGGLTFNTSRYLTMTYTEEARQESNTLFNASLTYEPTNEAFSLSVWARNITDERVMTGGDQFVSNYSRPVLQPPRTMGVSARYSF